jgi:hypothetical protein
MTGAPTIIVMSYPYKSFKHRLALVIAGFGSGTLVILLSFILDLMY